MERRALITGGGSGIGREIALAFAREGLAVAVGGRNLERLDETAAAIRGLGVGARVMAVELDVTDAAVVRDACERVTAELGRIDVLINNAGIAESAPFARTDPALWERHLAVNVTGPYLCAREILPGMLARGWGRVINVASLAGLYGAPYVTAYTASKHALVGFTRALATEVSGKGVTVNAICPGYVATEMTWRGARHVAARTGRSFDDAVAAMAAINPGRRLVEPAEIAAVAVKLLSDDATNGDAIVLDGS